MAIFFGNGVNVAVAAGLLNRRSHGPNLVQVPCETEENEQSSLRLTPSQVPGCTRIYAVVTYGLSKWFNNKV